MRSLAVFAAAAVVAAGLGAGTDSVSSAAQVAGQALGSTIGWGSCEGYGNAVPLASGLECADIEVPLDHARPDGDTVTIALGRIRATAPVGRRQGVLLINPGGPGVSGLSWVERIHSYPPRGRRRQLRHHRFRPARYRRQRSRDEL